MRSVNVHKAKTQLSQLIAAAEAGEEIVISRDQQPAVRLVPVGEVPKRVFGALAGMLSVGPEFFEALPEEALTPWEL